MRLNRLDLTRFGKFTQHQVDFGPTRDGQPDLHIIHGPNESGKTTLFIAILDLLFRIDARSPYSFLHSYRTMEIGASLTIGGRTHELVRLKQNQNDLLDGNRAPVPETLMTAALGGIDRLSYRAMFSLDDDTLEAGGDNILASRGDLGQLLFSASAGLAGIGQALLEPAAEADAFYRHRAHGGELSVLKERLSEKEEERKRVDTMASQYAALAQTQERAKRQYDEASKELSGIQTKLDAIQRRNAAVPLMDQIRAAREELTVLSDLPEAPPGWGAEIVELMKNDATLTERVTQAERAVEDRAAEQESIPLDSDALDMAAELNDVLGDEKSGLYARFGPAEQDIPRVRLEADELGRTIAAHLARLGVPEETNPETLILNAAVTGKVRSLIQRHDRIEGLAEKARQDLERARQALADERAKSSPNQNDTVTAAITAIGEADQAAAAILQSAISARDQDRYVVRAHEARRQRDEHAATLQDRLATLRPWTGDPDQLVAVPLPGATTIARWKSDWTMATEQKIRCETDLTQRITERERLTAELNAIVATTGAPSERDIARLRHERETAWTAHRAALSGQTADAFEAALRADDAATDARLRHQSDVARRTDLERRLALSAQTEAEAREAFDKAKGGVQRTDDMIATAIAAIIPGGMDLPAFEAWRASREKTLETREALRRDELLLAEAGRDAGEAARALSASLTAAHVPHDPTAPPDALLIVARVALSALNERKTAATLLRQSQREIARLEKALSQTETDDRAWRDAWEAAIASCWIGRAGDPPGVAAVREILDILPRLESDARAQTDRLVRITAMRDDQRAFTEKITALANRFGAAPAPPQDLARQLRARVNTARANEALRVKAREALDAQRAKVGEALEEQTRHRRRAETIMAYFGAATLSEASAKLSAAIRKTQLQANVAQWERDILRLLRAASIGEALEQLQQMPLQSESSPRDQPRETDPTRHEQDEHHLTTQRDILTNRVQQLFADFTKAKDALDGVGGDDQAARLDEERRTILLNIEDNARRWLKLRLGVAAAEQALRLYRQKHRGAMLDRASDAFRTISRGAYTGLATRPERGTDILIATAPDGTFRFADQLSKGTRFQLYLALRVAGYLEFARQREPVPFIADDIMETFDDFRAEEALRLLADMAKTGQVIYLTHHQHLRDIARAVCPSVRIHELPLARGSQEA